MSNSLFRSIAVIGFLAASLACAQEPVQNIDRERHGNLATAQKLVREAFDRLTEAQAANNYDLGGHADKAKELLRQANEEIKLAAESANRK